MAISVHVQYAAAGDRCPGEAQIDRWAGAALAATGKEAELTIRIVSEQEGAELNRRWRGKPGATNVLSFPAGDLGEAASGFLGDIVICAPVVAREAREQGKSEDAHWAHLVVHGTLHLLGYDHGNDADAGAMESLEIAILDDLGIANPYD